MSKILIQASKSMDALRTVVRSAPYHFNDPAMRRVMLMNYRGWLLVAYADGARPGIYGLDGAVPELVEMHGESLFFASNRPAAPKSTGTSINVTASGNARMAVQGSGNMVTNFGKGGQMNVSEDQSSLLRESDPKLIIVLPHSSSDRTAHVTIVDSTVACRRIGAPVISTSSNFSQF